MAAQDSGESGDRPSAMICGHHAIPSEHGIPSLRDQMTANDVGDKSEADAGSTDGVETNRKRSPLSSSICHKLRAHQPALLSSGKSLDKVERAHPCGKGQTELPKVLYGAP